MTLEEAVEQYKQLNASRKALEARLAILKERIFHELPIDQPMAGMKVQIRDRTTFSDERVYELAKANGWPEDEYTKRVIDPEGLEMLYYQGDLTDADLDYIREPKGIRALVEVKEVKDVPTEDDSERTGLRPGNVHNSVRSNTVAHLPGDN